MNFLVGALLFFTGSFFGVATMAIIQVGAQSERIIRESFDEQLDHDIYDKN